MKTLLLTSAAALLITSSLARADHREDQDGQERLVYGNSDSYGYHTLGSQWNPGFAGYNQGPYNPGWGANRGWGGNSGGFGFFGFNSPAYSGCNSRFGGCNGPLPIQNCGTGYPVWQSGPSPGLLPGGCYRYGSRVICPLDGAYGSPRVHQPWTVNGQLPLY